MSALRRLVSENQMVGGVLVRAALAVGAATVLFVAVLAWWLTDPVDEPWRRPAILLVVLIYGAVLFGGWRALP